MLSGRGGTTGCFNRPGPILAAGVQVADVQPQSLETSRTSPLGCTHGLSRSSASDPAPLNSDQLPSCGMDERSISWERRCRIEILRIGRSDPRKLLELFDSVLKSCVQNRPVLAQSQVVIPEARRAIRDPFLHPDAVSMGPGSRCAWPG